MERPGQGKSKGCLWSIVVGVLVFFLIVGSIVVWLTFKVTRSPEFRQATRMVGGAMTLFGEAMNAPGTPELREAGCEVAFALDADMVRRFSEVLAQGGVPSENDPVELSFPFVLCNVSALQPPPTCEDVARTYARAVANAPPATMVQVGRQFSHTPHCAGLYDASGNRLRDLQEAEMQGMKNLQNISGPPGTRPE